VANSIICTTVTAANPSQPRAGNASTGGEIAVQIAIPEDHASTLSRENSSFELQKF